MNRDQPPCNTCSKHDCRSCAWTSPLDASYCTLIRSHSMLPLFAVTTSKQQNATAQPSRLGMAAKRLVKFVAGIVPRAR